MAHNTQFGLKPKDQDSYLELVLAFPLASIKSDKHLAAAQKVMDRLLAEAKLDHGDAMYLDALSDLVATYEDDHHPIHAPTDSDLLRHLMDAKGITQAKLNQDTGIAKSTISEVLAGKKTVQPADDSQVCGILQGRCQCAGDKSLIAQLLVVSVSRQKAD
jgi:HTH-type transcriptional regulator/antitoxin HigA